MTNNNEHQETACWLCIGMMESGLLPSGCHDQPNRTHEIWIVKLEMHHLIIVMCVAGKNGKSCLWLPADKLKRKN